MARQKSGRLQRRAKKAAATLPDALPAQEAAPLERAARELRERELTLAVRRVGNSPDAWARWLLAFAERDPETIGSGEWVTFGGEMQAVIFLALGERGWRGVMRLAPLEASHVRDYQGYLRELVTRFLTGEWIPQPSPTIMRRAVLPPKVGGHIGIETNRDFPMLRFAETLIYVAVELLGQMADKQRLQQCLGYESHPCSRLLVAVRRQTRCEDCAWHHRADIRRKKPAEVAANEGAA
jgi:hypothetical protein